MPVRSSRISRAISCSLFAAAILITSAWSRAAFNFVSQSRNIRWGEYDTATPIAKMQGASDLDLTTTLTAPDAGPFIADLGSSFGVPGGGASQHSTIGADTITATGFTYPGFLYQPGSFVIKFDIGSQLLKVVFSLSSAQPFTLQYNGPPGTPLSFVPTESETVTLTGPGPTTLSFNPHINNFAQGSGSPTTYTGTLAAGTWTLQLSTTATSAGGMSTNEFYNFALTVPEPASGALLLLSAPLIMSMPRRRRNRAV